jgi:hypothetical protein
MTICTASGSLPRHLYVKVDASFVSDEPGWFEAVWFGVHAHVGRAWGCTVMLECGAVYRNLPPHALAFCDDPPPWTIKQAQLWDCYSPHFSAVEYTYLQNMGCVAKVEGQDLPATYLFTLVPFGDGFTADPQQDKEFMFLQTDDGRLTIQPTNRVRFIDKSFTVGGDWPRLRVQSETYSCED